MKITVKTRVPNPERRMVGVRSQLLFPDSYGYCHEAEITALVVRMFCLAAAVFGILIVAAIVATVLSR